MIRDSERCGTSLRSVSRGPLWRVQTRRMLLHVQTQRVYLPERRRLSLRQRNQRLSVYPDLKFGCGGAFPQWLHCLLAR